MEPASASISELTLTHLRTGTVIVAAPATVLHVRGPGAVECLQGVLTNDVERPGPGGIVYGALLTPKGMIITDLWALRETDGATLLLPVEGGGIEAARAGFAKQFPPRLARVSTPDAAWTCLWLLGPESGKTVSHALGSPTPEPGNAISVTLPGGEALLAMAPGGAPWVAVLLGSEAVTEQARDLFIRAGAIPGITADLTASRILTGWPALGAEIGEKTLPQEVRFDEHGGVSYAKGCYVGQETVARVHFRGHPNRHLRGLVWTAPTTEGDLTIQTNEGKEVGTVTSMLRLPGRHLGLALLRKEVEVGSVVRVGGTPARVVDLPFAPHEVTGEPVG